jgi:CRP/FNR family transcriptional regulator
MTQRLQAEAGEVVALRTYVRNEIIFTPTRDPRSVYILERGLVRIYRLSKSGDELTLGYVTSGEVFGELAAFAPRTRDSFAQAVVASAVRTFPLARLQRILSDLPGPVRDIVRQIGERLKRDENKLEDLVFRGIRSRIARVLLELADELSMVKSAGAAHARPLIIDVPLTQRELATLVGAARQRVNMALRDLEVEGLIVRRRGRIVILEQNELRKIVESLV